MPGSATPLINQTLKGLADALANSSETLPANLTTLITSSFLTIFESILKPAVSKMTARLGDKFTDSFRSFVVNGIIAELGSLKTKEGENIINWNLGNIFEKMMDKFMGGGSGSSISVVYARTVDSEVEAIGANQVTSETRTLDQLVKTGVLDKTKTLRTVLKDLLTTAIANKMPDISSSNRETEVNAKLDLTTAFKQVILASDGVTVMSTVNWLDKTIEEIIASGDSSPPVTLNSKLIDVVKKLEFQITDTAPVLSQNIEELANSGYGPTTLKSYLVELLAAGVTRANPAISLASAKTLAEGMLDRSGNLKDSSEDQINALDLTLSAIVEIAPGNGVSYPVTAQTTVRDLLASLVFEGAGIQTIKEWYTQVFKKSLDTFSLIDVETPGGKSYGELIAAMLPGTGNSLADLNGTLLTAFKNYEENTKTTTQISGISYDPDSRLLSRSETKTWKEIGGGGIPGLDTKWKNAAANVTTHYYYGVSDLYVGQAVEAIRKAGVPGQHEDPEVLRDGINLHYVEGDIKYNLHGQTASMSSVSVSPTEWLYSFVKKNWRTTKNKDNFISTNPLDLMATVTNTYFDTYNSQGQPSKTHSDWIKDDIMRSHGSTQESGIEYDALGQKTDKSVTTSQTQMDRGIDHNGDDGSYFTPPLGAKVISSWPTIVSGWKGVFSTLVSGGTPYKQANDAPGPRFAHRKSNTIEKSKNNYVYDLYGNLDEEATRNKSQREVTSWDDGDGAMSPLAKTLSVVNQVVAIVVAVVVSVISFGAGTPAALALLAAVAASSAAMASLTNSALNGVKFGTALGLAAIQAVAAAASTYAGGTANGLSSTMRTVISVVVSAASSVGSAALMGARGDDLWRSALAGAVSGSAGFVPGGGNLVVARVLVAAALNIAAARIEGVKNGNQLLLIGVLSGALAGISEVGQKPNSTANPDTVAVKGSAQFAIGKAIAKALVGAIVGYAIGLVIGNNIRGPTGQAVAAFVATIISAALTSNETTDINATFGDKNNSYNGPVSSNFGYRGFQDAIISGIQNQISDQKEQRPITLRYGPGEKDVETQIKDVSRQRSKEERAKNAFTSHLLSSAKAFASIVATDLKKMINPNYGVIKFDKPIEMNGVMVKALSAYLDSLMNAFGSKNGMKLGYEGFATQKTLVPQINALLLDAGINRGPLSLFSLQLTSEELSFDDQTTAIGPSSAPALKEEHTTTTFSLVNTMDSSSLSLFSAQANVRALNTSDQSSNDKQSLGQEIDVSKMQFRMDSRDSSYLVIRTTERKPSETVLTKEQLESVFAGVKGVQLDRTVLTNFKQEIAQLKKQGLIAEDAVLIGVRINGLAAVVAVKDNRIVGALFGNAAGQKEFRSFTSMQFNDKGQVMKAEGKIHREIGGQFEVRGSFVYAAKGSEEYAAAMTRAENLVQSGEALAIIKQADAVYTEKNNDGVVTRQVYIGKDENGGARVLASEHLTSDGSMRLLTYDYALTGEEKQQGMLAKGKIYESKGFSDKYGAAAVGDFKIRKLGVNADVTTSLGQAIVKELSLGGHERIVYEETTTKGKREISLNAATGGLEYVYEKGSDGKGRVVVFGDKVPNVPGVQVVKFNDLKANDQDQVLASLPSLDSRDPALITQKLVKMSESLRQQVALESMTARGFTLAEGKGDRMLFNPPAGIGLDGKLFEITQVFVDGQGAVNRGIVRGANFEAEGLFISLDAQGPAGESLVGLTTLKTPLAKGDQLLLLSDAQGQWNARILTNTGGLTEKLSATLSKSDVNAALARTTKEMDLPGLGGWAGRLKGAAVNLVDDLVSRVAERGAGRVDKMLESVNKMGDALGAVAIERQQLSKHGEILGVLLKSAGLDNPSTLSSVDALTKVDGLETMGTQMDALSQKLGDLTQKISSAKDRSTLKTLWNEVGDVKENCRR
ncbi:MAG: hypothetical protein IPN90_07290 [Elusimicrobia bacterium]|nr:hypothetical protein [Elusimicrobiota bacterium]